MATAGEKLFQRWAHLFAEKSEQEKKREAKRWNDIRHELAKRMPPVRAMEMSQEDLERMARQFAKIQRSSRKQKCIKNVRLW
jgi:hypothetical protein